MNIETGCLLFIIGLFFGSFGNVISLRLASGKPGILFGRSECPKCQYRLSWYENLPLVSWIFQAGKCRNCHKSISWQYPAAELFFGLLFGLVGIFTPDGEWFLLFWRIILVFVLGVITLSDLRYMDIPDKISLPLLRFLVFACLLVTFVKPVDGIPQLLPALLGAAVLFAFFAAQVFLPGALVSIRQKSWRPLWVSILAIITLAVWLFLSLFFLQNAFEKFLTHGKGASEEEEQGWIGGGDFRIAVIMGIALGPLLGLLAVFMGYFFGALFAIPILTIFPKSRKNMIPLGPLLVTGTMIALLWGEIIVDYYLRFIGLR